ncbi:MAG TPA: hypothetical protein VLK34_06530 [Nocardioidaceae bacterium]|nr:hypothetical protein [Nocardioidaceae bacterium]
MTERSASLAGFGDADLEYDLAHEAATDSAERASRPTRTNPPDDLRGAIVATETTDSGSDYGYDLAHDIPQQMAPKMPRKMPRQRT